MNVEASEAIVRGLKSAGVDLVATPGRGWRRADYLRNYMARKIRIMMGGVRRHDARRDSVDFTIEHQPHGLA
jgi:hypothetical protein